jgi:hypothetical protein
MSGKHFSKSLEGFRSRAQGKINAVLAKLEKDFEFLTLREDKRNALKAAIKNTFSTVGGLSKNSMNSSLKSPFERLPAELILMILEKVDLITLSRTCLASRVFYNLGMELINRQKEAASNTIEGIMNSWKHDCDFTSMKLWEAVQADEGVALMFFQNNNVFAFLGNHPNFIIQVIRVTANSKEKWTKEIFYKKTLFKVWHQAAQMLLEATNMLRKGPSFDRHL